MGILAGQIILLQTSNSWQLISRARETRTPEIRTSESQTTRINCTEGAHYPLYDPTNPSHNPRAPKRGRRRSSAANTDHASSEIRPAKSLRRAGSSIAAFAQSIRSKRTFRRPPIPAEKEPSNTLPDRTMLDQANNDLKLQPQSHFASTEPDNSTRRPADSMTVTADSTPRYAASPQTTAADLRGDCTGTDASQSVVDFVKGHTMEEFARTRYLSSSHPDHEANVTGNEKACPYLTADNDVSGLSTNPTEWFKTPPPDYSLHDEGYEAEEEDDEEEVVSDSPIVSRDASASHLLSVTTNATVDGAHSQGHHGTGEGDGISVDHVLLRRKPNLLPTDRSNDASPSAKSYATAIQSSPADHKLILAKSESSLSLEPGRQFLDVPKQRSSPRREKALSEAATEVDSDFGVEIYRTSRRGENGSMTDKDSSLRRALSSSTAHSETDQQEPTSDNLSPERHHNVQTYSEVGEVPLVANYSYRNPAAARPVHGLNGGFADGASQPLGYMPVAARGQTSTESTLMDYSGTINQGKDENEQCGSNCQESISKRSHSSLTFVETRFNRGPTGVQTAPLRTSSSVSCLLESSIIPHIQGALCHAVEAIDRLTGYELPDPHTQLHLPVRPKSQDENRQPARASSHNQGSSISGSNETGQSDIASSVRGSNRRQLYV